MKKIILELDPETNRATWIVKRDNKRTRYNPTESSLNRIDSIFVSIGLDYAMNYDSKFYLTTYGVDRIETVPVVEYPDDER